MGGIYQTQVPSSRGMFTRLGVNDYASGIWYPPTIAGASALAATGALAANQIALTPFFCRAAHTFTGMGITNAGNDGGVPVQVRAGIYGSANGRPANSLILDAGVIQTAGDSLNNVLRSTVISQALLANTLYFFAMIPATALTWWGYSAIENLDVLMESGLKNGILSATSNLPCFTGAQAFGALPANLPTLTEAAVTSCAAIQLKG